MPQKRPKSKKILLTVYTISLGLLIFAHILGWGLGDWKRAVVGGKV
jgi:hypothetical protein